MDAQTFLDNFGTIADAPGGADRLRALVLDLAVRGELVPQDPIDRPVSSEELASGRKHLIAVGQINKPRHPEGHPVENPPYSVPPRWGWFHLGDVGAVVGGGTPSSQESRFWAEDDAVPWLTPADMRSQTSRYVTRGERDITLAGLASSSAQLLPPGSVLFSSRAPIGHVGIAQAPLATNQGFKSCVPYLPGTAEYLYFFLKKIGPEVSDAATGTTFKEVSGKQVALIPIPLPPRAEQKRIVAKIDELMQLCDDLKARQQTRHQITTRLRASSLDALTTAETNDDIHTAWSRIHSNWEALTDHPGSIDALRQTIRQLAVRGKLVEQLLTDEPAAELIERSVTALRLKRTPTALSGKAAGPFPVPAAWTWADLQSLCRTQTGATPSKDHLDADGPTVAYVAPAQIRAGKVDETNLIPRSAAESTRRLAPPESVLFVGIGGGIGKCGLSKNETTFNQQIHAASPVEANAEYLAIVAASPFFQTMVRARTSATAIPIINKTKWVTIPIPMPPLGEQKRIAQRVAALTGYCDQLESQLAERERCANHVAGCIGGVSFAE